jgi:hypothetical protein
MALDRIECVEVFAADGLGAGIRPLAVLACASGGAVRLKQRRVLRGGPAKAGEPRSQAYVRGSIGTSCTMFRSIDQNSHPIFIRESISSTITFLSKDSGAR